MVSLLKVLNCYKFIGCISVINKVKPFLSVLFIEFLIVLRRNFRFERKKKFLVLLLDSLRLGLFYGFFTESLKLL